jgi:MOSC domain-containing protein YiiM
VTPSLKQINRSDGGLPKWAIAGSVTLTETGIENDRHLDLTRHGGSGKAVLIMAAEVIDSLAARGFPVFYGALGENLTVTGLDPHFWRTGQRYAIGEQAVIELTQLRVPCANLDVYGPLIRAELYDRQCKAGDISSPHWAHGGFYARVVKPGLLSPGAPIMLESDLA